MEKAQTSGCLDDLLDVEGRSLPRFDSPKIQGLGELDGLLLLGEVGLLVDEWPPVAPGGQLLRVRIGDRKVSYCLPRASWLPLYTRTREVPRLSRQAAGFASRPAHVPTIEGSWRFWIIRVKSSSAEQVG